MSSKIINLLIAKDINSPMEELSEIILEENKGIVGDRYHQKKGTFSKKDEIEPDRDVTLVEIENIKGFNETHNQNLSSKDFRRNIVVSNCDLNSLIDKEFKIGEVVLKGIRLCDPCKYLEKKLQSENFLKGMIGKAGLRAQIIKGGNINLKSQIEI